MNRINFLAFGIALLVCGQVSGQTPGRFAISSVTPGILTTPKYAISPDSKRTPPAASWLEIEVDFSSEAEYTPEVTLNYYVAINARENQTAFVGSTTLIGIPAGKNHLAVIYIAPQSLALISKGSNFAVNKVDQVSVQLTVQGQVVAEGSSQKNPPTGWWSSLKQQTGFLLNKNETPFAPLWWDRYEVVKPSTPGR